jgi:ABC-type transporter Mla subunit MlaD
MNFARHKKEAGQASRLLLILAVVVLVAAIIVFWLLKWLKSLRRQYQQTRISISDI